MKQITRVRSRKEQVIVFSYRGHDVLLEYDPATADMEEVNRVVNKYERELHGQAFSMATGEAVDTVTTETRDVTIVRPLVGG
jgi:nitrite reductase/ring-hydroxylating ferredoxin subunit